MKIKTFFSQNKKEIIIFLSGLLIVSAGLVPYLILGEKSVFDVLDQLDSDVAEYYLKAKHLFDGSKYFPEYFGGTSGSQIVPTSPGTLIFYVLFDTFKAFLINHILVILSAYVGMYALLRRLTGNSLISAGCAALFSYLPFYSIYGLGVAGVPLVILAYVQISEDDFPKPIAYINLALYGLFSSLALMGWAAFLMFGLGTLVHTVIYLKNKNKDSALGKKTAGLWIGTGVLGAVYFVTNLSMVKSFFFGIGDESQRSEFVFRPSGGSLALRFLGELLNDKDHFWARSFHRYIIFIGIAVLILCFIFIKKLGENEKRLLRILCGVYSFIILTALFSSIYDSETVVNLRNSYDNALASFQFDRFFYLYPATWYFALGVALSLVIGIFKNRGRVLRVVSVSASALLFVLCSMYVLKNSPFKTNLKDLVRPQGSNSLSWESFYEKEEYKEVADYIYREYGLTQDAYRIGNVGLEPAVAIVNGFYTIDGYSSVYSLEYKHRFRKAISRELEKNEINRQYFDEWGNRCYLFSSEYVKNTFLSKYTHPSFQNLELDTDSLKELGCKYLLSAGEIVGAEEKGYRLCKVFDAPEYTYFIYLYEVL